MQNESKFAFRNIMNLITSIILECGGASKTNGLEERGNNCNILIRNLEENGSFVKLR